ncbi:hypothetical protein [Herbaspirillum sp. RV1423]|uniref:hypothetical protein n=1 Tax=Herbaspirillum sp. RV1423 TaxID=1443993 RepID=UPI0004B3A9CE|nr:hypothetical protein [Herbaspirillum sp. RV1423]
MSNKTIAALLFFSYACVALPARSAELESGANNNAPSCVDVVVNGERIPAYDCLTQKLMPKDAGKTQPLPEMTSQTIVGKPSNQLGLFNYTATSNRMGNTFGTSVYPQRPPATPVAPVLPR